MGWFDSFLYLCLISILAFPLGRMIPKEWLHFDGIPFRSWRWELEGKFYTHLGIRKWQNKLPDMSKVMKGVMKRKELPENCSCEDVRYLLDETCVAEVVHSLLCIFGAHCMDLWQGSGGIIFYMLYVIFFNLPYILIQRYNRPRLYKLYLRMKPERSTQNEGIDPELQYGRRS